MADIKIENIIYRPFLFNRRTEHKKSIQVIGLDTEAYSNGRCFMICTSEKDVFKPEQYPQCFFNRKYQGKNFVAYNLKYDSGALLQHLPPENLKELQENDETIHNSYKYRVIANKLLSVRRGKNTIHIYDLLNFYNMSLDKAAKTFLNKSKIEIETKNFSYEYVAENWNKLVEYCIHDAVLCQQLADVIIKTFEGFGVYPRKLYSVAYVSWQYFREKCPYIHVKKFYNKIPLLLEYAMASYNGGKFEVTTKGTGYFYEYDIVSAYPYEISNLIDIRRARVSTQKQYRNDAIYAYLNCKMKIPYKISSPIAVKRGSVNVYPVGEFQKIITLNEYEYLIKHGADVTIIDGFWLLVDKHLYPYRTQIDELMEFKHKFKREKRDMEYHTVKIFLNSFYGKMVQLIKQGDKYRAGAAWNPIYSSVITANTRIRVSELQTKYPHIIAVHTDSVISTRELPFKKSGDLGDIIAEVEGYGVILGSGIYQIGSKSKIRGFDTHLPLLDMLPAKGDKLRISKHRPYTWREIAHRGLAGDLINRFENMPRDLSLNFDTKRIWLKDYTDFREVKRRNVQSVAWDAMLINLKL